MGSVRVWLFLLLGASGCIIQPQPEPPLEGGHDRDLGDGGAAGDADADADGDADGDADSDSDSDFDADAGEPDDGAFAGSANVPDVSGWVPNAPGAAWIEGAPPLPAGYDDRDAHPVGDAGP